MSQSILAAAVPGIYDNLVNGTCVLDQSFGTVIDGSIELPEDLQEIVGCDGAVSAVLLRNQKINYTFKALFPSGVDCPSRGDDVSFPDVGGETDGGLTGQVVSAKVDWSQGTQRMISITARHWTGLGSTPTVTAL